MAFEHPWALALVVPAVLVVWFTHRPAPVPRAEVAYGWLWAEVLAEDGLRRRWLRWREPVSLAVRIVALGLLIVALAGPLVPPPRAVVLVIDVSASMAATDVAPSRFEAAKRLAAEWIAALDAPDRLAIVTAGRAAMVAEPLGADRRRSADVLEALEPEPGPARLADALELARGMIHDRPNGRIVVLTDQPREATLADSLAADASAGDGQRAPSAAGGGDGSLAPGGGGDGQHSAADAARMPPPSSGGVEWVRFGRAQGNVAITRAAARRDPTRPDRYLVVFEVTNFAGQPARRRLSFVARSAAAARPAAPGADQPSGSAPAARDARAAPEARPDGAGAGAATTGKGTSPPPAAMSAAGSGDSLPADEDIALGPNQRQQRVVAIGGGLGAVEARLAPGDVLPADDRAVVVLGDSRPGGALPSAKPPSAETGSAETPSGERPSGDNRPAERLAPDEVRTLAAALDRAAESDLRLGGSSLAPDSEATAPRAPRGRWPIRAALVLAGVVLLVVEWVLYQRRWLS